MAVETKKSTYIGNRDASPTVATIAAIAGGLTRESYGQVVVSAAASVGSTYPMVSVPSNSRVSSVKIQSGAQGVGCTTDVGAYYSTEKGGAVISQAFFASAVDVSAAVAETEVKNESGTNTIALQEVELWKALGLASDPNCNIDIVATLTGAAVAGAALGLKVAYVQ
jgi:hypothetical protein